MSIYTPVRPSQPVNAASPRADSEWAATVARFTAIDSGQSDEVFDNAYAETSRYYWETVEKGSHWFSPNIVRTGEGEILLEWWQQEKKLTIYFSPDGTAEYLASWGTDISTEMDEGDVREPETFVRLWTWLYVSSPFRYLKTRRMPRFTASRLSTTKTSFAGCAKC